MIFEAASVIPTRVYNMVCEQLQNTFTLDLESNSIFVKIIVKEQPVDTWAWTETIKRSLLYSYMGVYGCSVQVIVVTHP